MSYYEDNILRVKPDFERDAIKKILASTKSWADFGPESPGGDEHIKPWQNIRAAPRLKGTEWAWSYNKANYWEFFQNTIFAGQSSSSPATLSLLNVHKLAFLGPLTKKYKGKMIPAHLLAIAETNYRIGENVELYKEKLVNLWQDTQKEFKSSSSSIWDAGTGGYADFIKSVFKLYGEMIGISFDLLPTAFDNALVTNHGTQWRSRYSSWTKEASFQFADFQEILLYLYLEEDNSRRDRAANVADESSTASEIEIPDDGSAVSELKAHANATREQNVNAGKDLTTFDRLALDSLTSGDDTFFENALRQSTQCILRLSLDSYVKANEKESGTYAKYPRFHDSIYLDKGPPASGINKLAHCPHARSFINIGTLDASSLVPMVRLFKTFYNKETNQIDRETEVTFDGSLNSSAWKDPLKSRQGVGIKSVDWSLNATNPATVRNDIEFNIVLYFQTFNDLLAERIGEDIITGVKENYKYEDLLLRPPVNASENVPEGGEKQSEHCANKKANSERYDPRFYEIKALVGWAPVYADDAPDSLPKAIRSQQLPMFLTLIDHEFSFTQQGTFELSIKYRARLEAIGNDPRLDVLRSGDSKVEIKEIEKEIESLQKTCGSEDTIEHYRGEITRIQEVHRDNLAQTIIDGLADKIYLTSIFKRELMSAIVGRQLGVDKDIPLSKIVNNIKISQSNVEDSIEAKLGTYKDAILADYKKRIIDTYAENHPLADEEEDEKAAEKAAGWTAANIAEASTVLSGAGAIRIAYNRGLTSSTSTNPDKPTLTSGYLADTENAKKIIIPWFYFGDLVNVVVNHALPKNQSGDVSSTSSVELKNLIYLFGSFQYNLISGFGGAPESQTAFLTSVPISLELYNQWYTKRVIDPDRSTYPILQFLRDFMSDVVIPSLNKTCFDSPEFRAMWYSGGNQINARPDYAKTKEELWQKYGKNEPLRKGGKLGSNKTAGYYTINNKIFPPAEGTPGGPYKWCEVPKVILKTAAISLPSDTPEPGSQGQNVLGPNPLERIHLASHAQDPLFGGWKYKGLYPYGWIDTGQWNPIAENGRVITRRENGYDQTLKNSYHVNVFYVIGSDNYKIFGPHRTSADPRDGLPPELVASWPTREHRDWFDHGVPHLYLGADRGLVKEVTFSKVDAPYLREARIQQDSLNPLALLAATYNVNLKLIGNTIFWPGQYIFINPIGFGSGIGQPDNILSVSNQLGLGGYHLITKVKSFIESGKFGTEVTALFEFSGDGCTPQPRSVSPACSGDSSSNAKEVDTPGYKP